jgi:hypothetical protein
VYGNLFEPGISNIYSTWTRQIPIPPYSTSSTSTSTVTEPETEVQLPVSRRTKTSRKWGRGYSNVAFYIFYISIADVGKWSLSRFKGNISGVQQTGEMVVHEDN